MTNAAVAEPVTTPASQGANASDSQAPTSQNDGAPNSANAGTDGAQSSETTLQTGAVEQAKPEATPAPTEPKQPVETDEQREQRIRQRIADEAAEATRRDTLTKTQGELRALRREGAETARELLNQIEERADIRLPAELRKPLLDWVETLNGKALDAAKLELGDDHQGAVSKAENDVRQEIVQGFIDSVPEADRPAFLAAVRGKPIDEWVSAARRFGGDSAVKDSAITEDRAAHDDAISSLLTEDKRESFAAELKAAKTPKARAAVIETFFRAAEKAAPKGTPTPTERNGGGSTSYADYMRLPESEKKAFNTSHPEQFREWLGIRA